MSFLFGVLSYICIRYIRYILTNVDIEGPGRVSSYTCNAIQGHNLGKSLAFYGKQK